MSPEESEPLVVSTVVVAVQPVAVIVWTMPSLSQA